MKAHPQVPHPYREIRKLSDSFHDKFLGWITEHVLASVVMFDAALIVPLLALPASNSVKLTLGVISGNWIQWWALPALWWWIFTPLLSERRSRHDRSVGRARGGRPRPAAYEPLQRPLSGARKP